MVSHYVQDNAKNLGNTMTAETIYGYGDNFSPHVRCIYPMDFKMHRDGKGANPESIDNYVTGVSECSQQRGNLKDDGYKRN